MLEIRSLSKRYGETVALDGASVSFAAGTVHTVMGENGSGKSTLVKLLSGIVSPDQGEILVDGAALRAAAIRPPSRRAGFATVFQEVLVAPDRNVIDNILLGYDGLFARRVPRDERRAAVADILSRCARTVIDLDVDGREPAAGDATVDRAGAGA